MTTALGNNTFTTVLKKLGSELHQEFEVAAGQTIKRGMPVKLDATGKIVKLGGSDNAHDLCIGYSLHNRGAGELGTVALRGIAIIKGQSADALDAGPVVYTDTVAAADRLPDEVVSTFTEAGTVANKIGWAIDQAAAADEEIRVIYAM